MIPAFVHDDLQALGIEIPQPMLERLGAYLDRLLEANQQMNLTAVREPDPAWQRLIIDSLTVLPWLEHLAEGSTVIDIGTGGGLPGIPLAITRPDLRWTLLDSTAKKVGFLRRVVCELDLANVTAIQNRAETLGQDREHRGQYDLAVARAVGSVSVVLECGLPLVKTGRTLLAMKGPKAEAELRDAGDALDILGGGQVQVFDAYPQTFDNDLVIIQVEKARPSPRDYPRAPGQPRKMPL